MRLSIPALAGILSVVGSPLVAQTPANAYVRHNLIADTASAGADFVDPGLVNPWGLVGGTLWVSDTGSGLSTVYSINYGPTASVTISGTKPAIPPAPSGSAALGTPTGIVTGGGSFPVKPGINSSFIFDTLDGTISAWANAADATHAIITVDNSASGAVYTGLALGGPVGGAATTQLIYAANFHSGAIEVYDINFKPVPMPGAFVDASLPAGYAPFNIWPLTLNGTTSLYVAYTLQDANKKNYAATVGAGVGYVDKFDMNGVLLGRVAGGGVLNAPWGLAIAPANFGKFAGMLLIGNFGDGRINAFDPAAGTSLGPLQDTSGNPITIPGLWALLPGNGGNAGDASSILFSAGIGNQLHGELGSIQAAPAITTSSVVNGGSLATGAAPNTFLGIFGPNLAASSRSWKIADFGANGSLPTSLDGVSVTINGKPAYISFISPKQINVLAPPDTTTGPVSVVVTNNGLASAAATVQMTATSPSFFIFKSNAIAALHADYSIIGATTLFPNLSTPAKPGETIVLYGTGFGATNPAYPTGTLISQSYPLATAPTVTIGGASAVVTYSGLVGAGLYQLNVTVPSTSPNGDLPVIATINGVPTQTGAVVTVQGP